MRTEIIVVTTISKFSKPTPLRTSTTIRGKHNLHIFFTTQCQAFLLVTLFLSVMYASQIQNIKSKAKSTTKIAATSQLKLKYSNMLANVIHQAMLATAPVVLNHQVIISKNLYKII
jgi:uncharacterized membrane protein